MFILKMVELLPLREGCFVIIQRGWLPKRKADRLLTDIKQQIPFGEYQVEMFGKLVDVPRGIFAFGDDGICTNNVNGNIIEGTGHIYGRPKRKYFSFAWDTPIKVLADEIMVPLDCSQPTGFNYLSSIIPNKNDVPIGVSINKIMKHLNKYTSGVQFNAVLLNAYRNGQDSIGAHSDQEVIAPDNEVYGISLGDSRIIHFVAKDGADKHQVELRHGDLFIMNGDTQEYYTHEIRKTKKNKELRVSLTFRALPVN